MTEILIISVIILFLYPVAMRVILERAQPTRQRMAELGCELLSSADYNDRQKELIAAMLDDAYEWRFMFFAVFSFPAIVWTTLVSGSDMHDRSEIEALGRDPRFGEFIDLHIKSTMAANPLCAIIFRFEIAIVLLFVASLIMVPLLVLATVAEVAPRLQSTKTLNHV